MKASDTTQESYNRWHTEPLQQSSKFPYIMSLGTDRRDYLLSFGADLAAANIVVTEAYEAMYHRIVNIREGWESDIGVLLTGEEGIGVSRILLKRQLL